MLGILRQSQAVFYALAFFWLDGFAVPAPAQVTQTVGRLVQHSLKEILMTQFKLSSREQEVINLVLQGKSNKLIAFELGISIRTVEFHLKNIYAKLKVNNKIELILKLGNTTGSLQSKKLVTSTVVNSRKIIKNRGQSNQLPNWTNSFTNVIHMTNKEPNTMNRIPQFVIPFSSILMIVALFLPVVSINDLNGKNLIQVSGLENLLLAANGVIGIIALYRMIVRTDKPRASYLRWLGIFSMLMSVLMTRNVLAFNSIYSGPYTEAIIGFSLPIGLLGATLMAIGAFANLRLAKQEQNAIA
jgi:DNA-binding CsgD family transcriptional regulator